MINEEKYLEWMEEYFNQLSPCMKNEIVKSHEETLNRVWNGIIYGRLGMHVRNYMREHHSEIDDDFPNYGDFEDYSWELFNKLIEKWKKVI